MINSRKTEDLLPEVCERVIKFKEEAKKQGLDFIITSTYRDFESQNELYAQGRTKKGAIVTNAKGGQSWHNWKRAIDIVPLRNGKPVWGTGGNGIDNNASDDATDDLELWQKIAAIGKSFGLEWAGDWKTFKEFPHFQYLNGNTLKDLQKKHPKGL